MVILNDLVTTLSPNNWFWWNELWKKGKKKRRRKKGYYIKMVNDNDFVICNSTEREIVKTVKSLKIRQAQYMPERAEASLKEQINK